MPFMWRRTERGSTVDFRRQCECPPPRGPLGTRLKLPWLSTIDGMDLRSDEDKTGPAGVQNLLAYPAPGSDQLIAAGEPQALTPPIRSRSAAQSVARVGHAVGDLDKLAQPGDAEDLIHEGCEGCENDFAAIGVCPGRRATRGH